MRRVGGESPGGEYERYRDLVLRMLAKRFPRLDEDERLAIYHDCWARVYVKRQRGEEIESLRAYLLATAGGEALHAVSRGKPPLPVGPDDPCLAMLTDDRLTVEDEIVVRDQARIARNLLDTLDERQREVLKLRWDLQLSGTEVRAALGLSRRQYQRLAEEGAAAIAERVREFENGDWSRRQRSLLTACLVEIPGEGEQQVGIASRDQRERAQQLLESDPHVAALYMEVRDALRRATALLPLPAFVPTADTSPLDRLLELVSAVRGHLSDAVDAARQQATSLYLRTADPALLAGGPRPGTAVVAIAGCLAIGGGAYGAHEIASAPSPPPISAAAVASQPSSAPTTTATPPATTRSRSHPKPQPKPKQPTPPKELPMTTPPTQQAPAPQPTPPSPTPAQPSGEFGFED